MRKNESGYLHVFFFFFSSPHLRCWYTLLRRLFGVRIRFQIRKQFAKTHTHIRARASFIVTIRLSQTSVLKSTSAYHKGIFNFADVQQTLQPPFSL